MEPFDKLVKALRACARGVRRCDECYQDKDRFDCHTDLMRDAADAIEALQAQLPKRGKWIHDVVTSGTTAGGVTYEHHYTCSVCGGLMGRKGDKFCYNCGAEMFASDTNVPNKNDTMDGPIITPCRGCSDYDGYGGCKSKGGCARAKMEVQDGSY